MKIKTADAQGIVLDWLVCSVTGLLDAYPKIKTDFRALWKKRNSSRYLHPSTDWSQGGPIIEREKIGLDHYPDGGHRDGGEWAALTNEGRVESFGPTPLIAAMRCYVAYKLGDEVDVPEELCAPQT